MLEVNIWIFVKGLSHLGSSECVYYIWLSLVYRFPQFVGNKLLLQCKVFIFKNFLSVYIF